MKVRLRGSLLSGSVLRSLGYSSEHNSCSVTRRDGLNARCDAGGKPLAVRAAEPVPMKMHVTRG